MSPTFPTASSVPPLPLYLPLTHKEVTEEAVALVLFLWGSPDSVGQVAAAWVAQGGQRCKKLGRVQANEKQIHS